MPAFTKIPKSFRDEYAKKFTLTDNDDIAKRAEFDPVVFAYHFLGIKFRLHQGYIIDRLLNSVPKTEYLGKRIAMCIARQLGKSLGFCIFCVWACWYDKYPSTMFNETIIYVTSRDDPAAEDIIKKIRKVLVMGDKQMQKFTDSDDYFTGSLKEPNNKHELTFQNNSYVGSFPPTMTSLGKSCSWLFIDEAHRLNCIDTDPDTFFDYASSIVAETGGNICLSSSPQGQLHFFYKAIDPEGKSKESNEYDTIWFSHEIWNDDSLDCRKHKAFVKSELRRLTEAGRFKFWQQEHMALFTVTESSFFDHSDVDDGVKDTPQEYEYHDTPCSASYDYGMTKSRTVITIRTKRKDKVTKKEEVIQLFQFRGKAGFDNNLLHDPDWEHSIQNLKKRYPLGLGVYADDCPNGNDHNTWMKNHIEIPVHLYNFRSDQMSKTDGLNRNCVAYSYRIRLKQGIIKIPKWNVIQQSEMKTVQETENKILITIKAPEGQLCDTWDSDMMACIPFLDMKSNISFSVDVNPDVSNQPEQEQDRNNLKYDGFKALTDEQCRELIKDANAGLIE